MFLTSLFGNEQFKVCLAVFFPSNDLKFSFSNIVNEWNNFFQNDILQVNNRPTELEITQAFDETDCIS